MAILVRRDGKKWQSARKLEFKEESHLQRILFESPDLIVAREDELPVVLMREAGLPGSGYTDLVGVDAAGNILIIETKLAKNPEIRRKVIGQVLEYAAFLWRMRFEDFDELFKSREGKSIRELFSERSDSLPIEEITRTITENLEQGRFKLLIAVGQINPELEKIIAYVSSFRGGLVLEALEVNLYQEGDTEVFVPQRHGQVSAETGRSVGALTIDEVIANSPNEHSRHLYRVLVDEWIKLGHLVQPASAGASFKADINEQLQPIFWAFPRYVQALMSPLTQRGVPPELLARYRSALASLPGFDKRRMMSDAKPPTELSRISEAEIRGFIMESDKLVDGWRKAVSH
jgi:hypothetical protein